MSRYTVTIDGSEHEVEIPVSLDDQLQRVSSTIQDDLVVHTVFVDGLPVSVTIPELGDLTDTLQYLILDDRPLETSIDPNMKWVKSPWGVHTLEIRDVKSNASTYHNGNGRIKAPIPGLIIQVKIALGEAVEAGQPLFILEAMKMENEIRAPRSGIIKSISVAQGQSIAFNQILAEIE